MRHSSANRNFPSAGKRSLGRGPGTSREGYTLFEVLIAMTMLALLVPAIMIGQSSAWRHSSQGRLLTNASRLIEKQVAQLQQDLAQDSLLLEDDCSFGSDTVCQGVSENGVTVTYTAQPALNPGGTAAQGYAVLSPGDTVRLARRIVLTARWTHKGRADSMTVPTFITVGP